MSNLRIILLILAVPVSIVLCLATYGWIVLISDPPPLPPIHHTYRRSEDIRPLPRISINPVTESRIVRRVEPDYPELVRQMRLRPPYVRMEVTVGTKGQVTAIKIVRGHLLCDDAAELAVSQWQFTPTLLNGSPAEVLLPVRLVCGDPYHGILDPDIALLIDRVRRGGTVDQRAFNFVHKGRADIEITLVDTGKRAKSRLAALGFISFGTSTEKFVLVGSIPVESLDALRELPGLNLISPHRR